MRGWRELRQRHVHGAPAGQSDVGPVAVVAGIEHDHLVAGVNDGEDRGDDGLGCAGGDGDLGAGVVAAAVERLDLRCHGFAQHRHAGHRRVLVQPRAHGLVHRIEQPGVAVEVGVHVQIAAQVRQFHQLRQAAGARRFDLAAIFAQLGRDPGQADAAKHRLLGVAGDALAAAEHTVLVDL